MTQRVLRAWLLIQSREDLALRPPSGCENCDVASSSPPNMLGTWRRWLDAIAGSLGAIAGSLGAIADSLHKPDEEGEQGGASTRILLILGGDRARELAAASLVGSLSACRLVVLSSGAATESEVASALAAVGRSDVVACVDRRAIDTVSNCTSLAPDIAASGAAAITLTTAHSTLPARSSCRRARLRGLRRPRACAACLSTRRSSPTRRRCAARARCAACAPCLCSGWLALSEARLFEHRRPGACPPGGRLAGVVLPRGRCS